MFFAVQHISVAIQYFIIMVFCHTFYLVKKASCNLDNALVHIVILIIF